MRYLATLQRAFLLFRESKTQKIPVLEERTGIFKEWARFESAFRKRFEFLDSQGLRLGRAFVLRANEFVDKGADSSTSNRGDPEQPNLLEGIAFSEKSNSKASCRID